MSDDDKVLIPTPLSRHLAVKLVEGDVAPKYEETTPLTIEEVVVTEKGMASGLPLVDLVCRDSNGRRFLIVTTGKVICTLAGVIRGVNFRNHGKAEP